MHLGCLSATLPDKWIWTCPVPFPILRTRGSPGGVVCAAVFTSFALAPPWTRAQAIQGNVVQQNLGGDHCGAVAVPANCARKDSIKFSEKSARP